MDPKQVFYVVAVIILMIIANRIMAKVKDPEELSDQSEEEFSEDAESEDIETDDSEVHEENSTPDEEIDSEKLEKQ